jgi:hypothetical protein
MKQQGLVVVVVVVDGVRVECSAQSAPCLWRLLGAALVRFEELEDVGLLVKGEAESVASPQLPCSTNRRYEPDGIFCRVS